VQRSTLRRLRKFNFENAPATKYLTPSRNINKEISLRLFSTEELFSLRTKLRVTHNCDQVLIFFKFVYIPITVSNEDALNRRRFWIIFCGIIRFNVHILSAYFQKHCSDGLRKIIVATKSWNRDRKLYKLEKVAIAKHWNLKPPVVPVVDHGAGFSDLKPKIDDNCCDVLQLLFLLWYGYIVQ